VFDINSVRISSTFITICVPITPTFKILRIHKPKHRSWLILR
jgi:hypothetical protein